MKESLFSYLTAYVPTDKRKSKEDYLTQMFAWILENVDGFAESYVRFLCGKNANIQCPKSCDMEISVSTQYTVPNGRIDMLLRVNEKLAFVCEHKVFSELHENQIQKYMNGSADLGTGKYYSVLVTFSVTQHTQEADVSIAWSDIHQWVCGLASAYEHEEAFVLNQFIKYLEENGMGKMKALSMDSLRGYWPAMELESQLNDMFMQLAVFDWRKACPKLAGLNDSYNPTFHKLRWGRIGVDFFDRWDTGVFAGVIVDPSNHKLPPMDRGKGPDFVVLLESDYAKNDNRRETYEKNIHSKWYEELMARLRMNSETFEFIPGLKESPWRIAVLRKPLYDILFGVDTKEAQIQKLGEQMADGINLLLG